MCHDAAASYRLEIFSKFRYASKNDFAVHDFANPPVTPMRRCPHATFGGRRSVGAVLPSFLSQSHGEHGVFSDFPRVSIFILLPPCHGASVRENLFARHAAVPKPKSNRPLEKYVNMWD
jgi:hypothetical protein